VSDQSALSLARSADHDERVRQGAARDVTQQATSAVARGGAALVRRARRAAGAEETSAERAFGQVAATVLSMWKHQEAYDPERYRKKLALG
jgi:hypothetical protein